MKSPAAAAMPTFSWEGGTHALRSQARFAQGRPTEGSIQLPVCGAGVADPSQAQDDIHARRKALACPVDGYVSSTERHGKNPFEAGSHLVAVATPLDVADDHESNGVTIQYRLDRTDVPVAVQQRKVALASPKLRQRSAPLQLVANPAEHRRRARVRRHRRGRRILAAALAHAFGNDRPTARPVLIRQAAHLRALVGAHERLAV